MLIGRAIEIMAALGRLRRACEMAGTEPARLAAMSAEEMDRLAALMIRRVGGHPVTVPDDLGRLR